MKNNKNLSEKLYDVALKELTDFENGLDTVKKALEAAYEVSVKRDILSYIENEFNEISDNETEVAVTKLIDSGCPLAIIYDEWLGNEYDNRMEAIKMTVDDEVEHINADKARENHQIASELMEGSYNFTVISFDGGDEFAVDAYVEKDDPAIFELDEFKDYVTSQDKDVNEIEVNASFYTIGKGGEESDSPSEEQLQYINEHLETVLDKADLLESNTFNVDISEIERDSEKYEVISESANSEKNKTLIVNIYGGPGAGKSTAALQLVAELKKRGYHAEYVSEVAKEYVYAKKFDILDGSLKHQKQILSEQQGRVDLMMGNVDVAITDSPLLLNTVYLNSNERTSEYSAYVLDEYNKYNNYNIYIDRDLSIEFEKEGRIHNLSESIEKDGEIKAMLISNNIAFDKFDRNNISRIADKIVDNIEGKTKDESCVYPWVECDDIISAMKQHWEGVHETNPSVSDSFDNNNFLFPKEPRVVARIDGKEYYNLDESIEQIKLFGKEWLDPFDAAIEMNRRGVDIKDIEMLNVRYVSIDGSVGNKDITPEQYVVYHIRSEEHGETMKQAIDKYNTKAQNFLEAQNKVNTEVTQFFQNKVSDILFYSLSEKQIFTLTEANKNFSSDEEKIEIAKHIVPQNGAALYEIMCNNPIENELKTIGISPSEIVPKFKPLDNGMELMWNNVSVKINWQEYAKACFDAAEANATAIKEKIQNTVLYKKSASEARETGELDLYQRSNKVNRQCSHMIDAVASSHYENNHFHAKDTLDDIMARGYTIDRIALVVAVNIADKDWDRRLSNTNISWANEFLSDFPAEMMERRKGEYYVTMHPGLLNMLVDAVRDTLSNQKETYINKLDDVVEIAEKIANAIGSGELDKEERSVGQER